MRRILHSPRFSLAALVAAGAIALASCGGSDGPSVSADPDTSTTSSLPTSTTLAGPTTSTTPPTTLATGDGQVVTFNGIALRVPSDWPVHDLAADPNTCVRADVHAVYLGNQGSLPKCPAREIGTTETALVQRLADAAPLDVARATQPTTINGLSALVDPNPDVSGALTAVFPDQGAIVVLTYGANLALVQQILASAVAA